MATYFCKLSLTSLIPAINVTGLAESGQNLFKLPAQIACHSNAAAGLLYIKFTHRLHAAWHHIRRLPQTMRK